MHTSSDGVLLELVWTFSRILLDKLKPNHSSYLWLLTRLTGFS